MKAKKGPVPLSRIKLIGLSILSLFLVMAIFAPIIAPNDPRETRMPYQPPSQEHYLGTNDIGQDILSELIYASRVSLTIGFLAGLISVTIGATLGILAGYYRGGMEELVMATSDVVLLVPGLPLMIILAAYLSPSMWNIVLAVGLLWWCSTARVVHSRVLQLREMPFVEAARSLGGGDGYIMLNHILINTKEIIYAKFALAVASAMLTEASLSFLGLGDPLNISWGEMIHFAFSRGGFANDMWWWYLPPGLMICACVLGFAMISMEPERSQKALEP
ncbi:MAG: ABC transporter permease [Methanothrix sp.]|jgi:peptide/nickel transport system permease protein|uniref:ABC transporter permease n=1 Tax=Methanothrix TaxID=2222 RepID=UPI001BD65FAE|nr:MULTISPECIES: ABC transporter permease [Methanothrix]MBK7386085.1 ABC transporter permease [Methanothrix sp.]HPY93238.1 ABC transporter permease [Methanothrix soehngenii]